MMLLIYSHNQNLGMARVSANPSISTTRAALTKDNLIARYSADWNELQNNDCRILYYGPTYIKTQINIQHDEFLGPHWLAAAHRLDGAYLLIRLFDTHIEISRSLYRGLDIFYLRLDGRLIFSTDFSYLVEISGENSSNLDGKYCHDFIIDSPAFSGSTAFSAIKSLQLGQSIRTDLDSITELSPQVPRHTDGSPIDILTEKLSHLARQFDSVYLSFSGGLDSSVIFYCLKRAGVSFTPFHGVNTTPYAENELAYATDIAQHFGIELQVRFAKNNIEQACFTPSTFTKTTYPTPFAVDIFTHPASEASQSQKNGSEYTRRLYLTGQGGDHVFLQNPGWNVGIDDLLKFRIGKSLSQISNYCQLKGENLYALLYRTIKLALHKNSCKKILSHTPPWISPPERSDPSDLHYLLKNSDPRSAKFRHISTILAGLSGLAWDDIAESSTVHPMLLPDMIGTVLDRPVGELYTAKYDRILLRQAAYQAAGHNFSWRQTKRSSATDYFTYFRNYLTEITQWLESGILVNNLQIDLPKLRQSLEFNGYYHLNNDFPALINLIQLEAYIQSTLHFSSSHRNSYAK